MKSIFLAAALFWSVASSAQIVLNQDTTGNLTWTVTSNRVLTISGSGDMPDYKNLEFAPWYSYKDFIATVVIGDSVTKIGAWAFHKHGGLTNVTIGNGVITIGIWAFDECIALNSITIPDGVTTIGAHAFYGCTNLESVAIPNSVTTIQWGAFAGCTNLVSITLPNGVKSIAEHTFYNCTRLTSVIMPGVTTIGRQSFTSCFLLDSVIFPNSLITIEDKAFSSCTTLNSITIPENVTTIGNHAFEHCFALNSVTIHARTPPALGLVVFNDVPVTIPVYIPCGTYEAYSAAWRWGWGKYYVPIEFTNYIEPTIDTGFYYATFKQGEPYNDANFTDLIVAGKYCNTLQSADGCDSIVCLILTDDETDVIEMYCNASLPKVYPNPVQSQLCVKLSTKETADYTIYTVMGQKIMQGKLQDETIINVADLATGMYYLRIVEKTIKFIKQ